jgi:hypothetical protein
MLANWQSGPIATVEAWVQVVAALPGGLNGAEEYMCPI